MIVNAGDHIFFSTSRQIWPLESTLGWNIEVVNLTFGGEYGYSSVKMMLIEKLRPLYTESGGPSIVPVHSWMSAVGKATMPGQVVVISCPSSIRNRFIIPFRLRLRVAPLAGLDVAPSEFGGVVALRRAGELDPARDLAPLLPRAAEEDDEAAGEAAVVPAAATPAAAALAGMMTCAREAVLWSRQTPRNLAVRPKLRAGSSLPVSERKQRLQNALQIREGKRENAARGPLTGSKNGVLLSPSCVVITASPTNFLHSLHLEYRHCKTSTPLSGVRGYSTPRCVATRGHTVAPRRHVNVEEVVCLRSHHHKVETTTTKATPQMINDDDHEQ